MREVKGRIRDGTLKPGDRVTITGLQEQWSCARQTAGKALRLMATEGVIIRYPGVGYFVVDPATPHN